MPGSNRQLLALAPSCHPTLPPFCRAWREGVELPFLLDNVWDVLRLLDYLASREDADLARVGVTGVSLGGMHAWLAAAADPRIAVAAPMIGVQNFGWVRELGECGVQLAEREWKGQTHISLSAGSLLAVWVRLGGDFCSRRRRLAHHAPSWLQVGG